MLSLIVMMATRHYTSRFTNQYVEQWEFHYDLFSRKGIVRGSDIDWKENRVIEGRVPELILNEEEI